uniref:C2H2-type domain-containing protein n=1 Tax=Anopheles farauti TaxID=69004 RepID=A0A182QU88_9DIPT
MEPVSEPAILTRFNGMIPSRLVKRNMQPAMDPLRPNPNAAIIPSPATSGIASRANLPNKPTKKRIPKPNIPVECKRCKKKLPSVAALIRHCIFEHHTPTGWKTRAIQKKDIEQYNHLKRKLVCGTCGVCVFDTKEEVRQHMIDEHGLKCHAVPDDTAVKSEDESNKEPEVVQSKSPNAVRSNSPEPAQKRSLPKPNKAEPRASNFLREDMLSDVNNGDRMEAFWRTITSKTLLEWYQHEKPHKCSRKGCQYKFASYEVREQHLRCHAENDPAPDAGNDSTGGAGVGRKRFTFKCIRCDRKFDAWKPCLAHLWHDHQTDLGMLRCLLCEKRFTYVVHALKHLNTHRPKALRDVACRYGCGQKFANAAQRSAHESGQHRKKETGRHGGEEQEIEQEKLRWYSERRCNICKHMFSNTKILSKHIKTVHLQIKPFVCNVCGYKCARKATLNIHIRQHSGLKPLACKSCPFRTADPSALSYHERRHRLDKAYRCGICGSRHTQPSTLRHHMQSQHPLEYQRMKCTLCDFASINAQNLRRHQTNHKAGLIKTNDEDSRPEADGSAQERQGALLHGGRPGVAGVSAIGRVPDNVPEISSDCFLPLESVDSMVHDTGGITIPAAVVTVPAALSEETQFPI